MDSVDHVSMPIGRSADEFLWAAGIENTFIPQARTGHRPLEEYELMGHYEHWREDLDLARQLGLRALRWGVPWYRVQPERNKFDWSFTDDVIPYLVEELGILPIIDLMHYGCPFWLKREFANKDYPSYVSDYAGEFGSRYAKLISWYTPLNEPIINSMMCGMRALWPPYLKGDAGYVKIMLQLARGIVRTVKTLKQIDPSYVMVHVEATGLNRTVDAELHALASEEEMRGYLCFDLISGRLNHNHQLFSWLVRNGTPPASLYELEHSKAPLDVVGLNFYPQWSTKLLYIDEKGKLAFRETEPEGEGFGELIEKYYERYQTAIMVTETSAVGDETIRERWLGSSLHVVKRLRGSGIPIIGYTWFPLFTMVDWRYRFSQGPVEDFYLELGLYRLNRENAQPRWLETPLVEKFRSYVADPAESVGSIAAVS